MKILLTLCFVLFLTQTTPKLTLSAEKIPENGFVAVHGTGFTARRNVSSHLRKPDGTEYPVLPILTDANGEFVHDIDTRLLAFGTHECWVVDEVAKTTSNLVKFEVVNESSPLSNRK